MACPSRRDAADGYAYNSLLDHRSMKRIANPSLTPMVFESSLNRSTAADKLQSFVRPHVDTGNVAFVDGHVHAVKAPPHATDGLAKRSSGSRGSEPSRPPEPNSLLEPPPDTEYITPRRSTPLWAAFLWVIGGCV